MVAAAALALLMAASETRLVPFAFSDGVMHASVVVVGGFNEWDRARSPLASTDGVHWRGEFRVPVGVYPYLFCVDNARWISDPTAPKSPDANGNVNSKLIVAPADYDAAPAVVGDGHVTRSALRHRPDVEDTIRLDEKTVGLGIRTRRADVARVLVRVGGKDLLARQSDGDELYDFWRVEIPLPPDGKYTVLADDGGTPVVIGRYHQAFAKIPLPNPPAWLRDAVFYQIFPDRYANGDLANDGPDVQPWGSEPTHEGRMGGDLKGVGGGLDRIAALGANAIYLNPIFASGSNHGYDTDDYERVDPRFGTNADLKRMVSAAHARKMRVILDGVFNHSSPNFFAFRDLRKNGAASKYRDWYFPLAYPIVVGEGQKTYRTFAGVPNMPKLNQENAAARDYFVGIGEKWVREAGIDGWRLDVADEIAPSFLRVFRQGVRKARSDAYLVGETWGDAHRMVQGDGMDASMNYRWRDATLRLVNRRIAPEEYVRLLREIDATVPVAARRATFNILGSHDTERLRTVLGGSEAKQRLAAAIQFFSPGVPVIYYGDEYGLEGGKEPASRNAMPKEPTLAMRETEAFYRRMAALRKRTKTARAGFFSVRASGAVLTLEYRSPRGRIALVANLSDSPISPPSGKRLKRQATDPLAPGGFAIVEEDAP